MIIIFDVDGTLLDTYDLIKHSYQYVFDNFLPNHHYTEEDIKRYFGPPLENTFKEMAKSDDEVEMLVEKYHQYNIAHHKDYLKIYPHVQEGLKILKSKNHKLGVVSNKVRKAIEQGFAQMGILEYFDVIVGLDEVINPKPHPEGINKILSLFPNEKAMMVGDTTFDILTAKNAKIKSVGVTYALTKKEDFKEIDPDYIIDDFLEIIKIVEEN